MSLHILGRRPDFLIIGEAKCGTTTLWQILGRLPQVFLAEEKELHFFSSYTEMTRHGRLQTDGLKPYLQRFAEAGSDQICGEATPNYLFDDECCERIWSVLPRVRLVAILRDPVARAWSHYWHQVRRGWESLEFQEALAEEEGRIASGDPNRRARYSYRARGRYVDGLRRYEQRFSREQLCVVFLEDLLRDPRSVIAQVATHLGLPDPGEGEEWSLPHANKALFPRWPRFGALARSARRWADAKDPRLAGPVRAVARVTRPVRAYSGAPRMNDEARRDLRAGFAESDRELSDWLGRSPPWLEGANARLFAGHP